MRIGIIGSGFIGRAVAQLALAAGHEVLLSNSRGPQTMSSVLSGIPGSKVGTTDDAAQFGELALIAIPLEHYRKVPAHAAGRQNRDGCQQLLPGSRWPYSSARTF